MTRSQLSKDAYYCRNWNVDIHTLAVNSQKDAHGSLVRFTWNNSQQTLTKTHLEPVQCMSVKVHPWPWKQQFDKKILTSVLNSRFACCFQSKWTLNEYHMSSICVWSHTHQSLFEQDRSLQPSSWLGEACTQGTALSYVFTLYTVHVFTMYTV